MTSDPEVLEDTGTPRIRRLEWEDYSPPPEFEEYGFLARERGEAASPQSFAFTLHCRPEAADTSGSTDLRNATRSRGAP